MPRETASASHDRQWYIVSRWEEFDGETRANLLRIIAIGSFYLVQLATYYQISDPNDVQRTFHLSATAVAVCWTMVALGNLLCLQRRVFPFWLKFVSTGADLILLTALASVGSAAQSPLVLGYFLIIALAGVRFSLRLVWCASIGSVLGYLFLLASRDPDWFPRVQVPVEVRFEEKVVMTLSLALTGVIVGQIVRRVRSLAEHYAERIHSEGTESLRAKEGGNP